MPKSLPIVHLQGTASRICTFAYRITVALCFLYTGLVNNDQLGSATGIS